MFAYSRIRKFKAGINRSKNITFATIRPGALLSLAEVEWMWGRATSKSSTRGNSDPRSTDE